MAVNRILSQVNSLRKQAAKRPPKPQAQEAVGPLLNFIPRISPKYMPPRHLRPLLEKLEAARTRPIRVVVSVPPRHGKTESLLHAIAWWLAQEPEKTCGYASYAADLTRSKSRKARAFAERAGVQLAPDLNRLNEWRTLAGGGLLATSTGGPLTGHGVDRMIVDDPIKDRMQAESKLIRDRIWDWFTDVVMTRIEPSGSVIVCMTRWHEDDLSGRLLKEQGKHAYGRDGELACKHNPDCPGCGPEPEDGWEEVNLSAVIEDAEAGERTIWPERWPLEAMKKRRREVGEYTWWSLFMGRPRPRGNKLFDGAFTYQEAPTEYRLAIGVDLAYSAKTSADRSVAVALAETRTTFPHPETGRPTMLRRYYLMDAIRAQTTAPKFALMLKAFRKKWGGAPMFSYVSGMEKGVLDTFAQLRDETGKLIGVVITAILATTDKFQRAQEVSAEWNAGHVLVPAAPEHGDPPDWVEPVVTVVCGFTGINDSEDDEVDALASAYAGLQRGAAFLAGAEQAGQLARVLKSGDEDDGGGYSGGFGGDGFDGPDFGF